MRRSKRTKEADEDASEAPPAHDAEAPAEDDDDGSDVVEDLQARLAPIEEFRSKSDSWMKETSAHLARISTHVQQDEKRQSKLDERLAEFEDRLQAMLQLTEAISMDQNPFVAGKGGHPASPGASAGPAARPHEDAQPARTTTTPPHPRDDDGNVLVIPVDGHGYVGRPAPRGQGHPNDAAAETEAPEPRPEPSSDVRSEPGDEAVAAAAEADLQFSDAEDNPFFSGPSTLAPAGQPPEPTPEPERPAPEPPRAETKPRGPAEPPSERHVRPVEDAGGEHVELGTSAARDAERRLAFLQVAGLLARHLRPMEIDAFLDTYAQTGWIEHRDITKIRSLASDLARNRRDPVQRVDREELHMRVILLMSRIAASFDRQAPRQLDRLFEDSRKIAHSEWMNDRT